MPHYKNDKPIREAAKILGISKPHFLPLVKERKIRTVKIGRANVKFSVIVTFCQTVHGMIAIVLLGLIAPMPYVAEMRRWGVVLMMAALERMPGRSCCVRFAGIVV